MKKKFHIITYGCQMNKYDSLTLKQQLNEEGHYWADKPETAELIIVNTCAVRLHAENRALGRLKTLIGLKKKRSNIQIGIMGCVAQELGAKLLEILPGIDFVVGTDQVDVIADIASGVLEPATYTNVDSDFLGLDMSAFIPKNQVSSFVTIMRGCNNLCSYCIVPYVRGKERSKPEREILSEIQQNINRGIKEIILLGQNVNSYKYGNIYFHNLLRSIMTINGVKRLRFVTNHPKDFSDKILDIVKECSEIIPPAFHLPLQSGSDKILSAMNRKYDLKHYMKMIENIYRCFPNAAISTDIIVGFPGETEQDFKTTLETMRAVEFAGSFSFRYSVRPGTYAASLEDDVPEKTKIERLQQIIDLGIKLAETYSQKLVGTVQQVLVSGTDKKNPSLFKGTAPSGRNVLIVTHKNLKNGEIIPVYIERATAWVLRGRDNRLC